MTRSDSPQSRVKQRISESVVFGATVTPGALRSEDTRYASFFSRLIAYFLDNLLIFVLMFSAIAIAAPDGASSLFNVEDTGLLVWMIYGFYTLASAGYFTILTGGGGQTVGKWLMGVKVISQDGAPVSYGGAFIRFAGYYISGFFLYIGFLIALIDARGQTFHDKIAKTVVVEIE